MRAIARIGGRAQSGAATTATASIAKPAIFIGLMPSMFWSPTTTHPTEPTTSRQSKIEQTIDERRTERPGGGHTSLLHQVMDLGELPHPAGSDHADKIRREEHEVRITIGHRARDLAGQQAKALDLERHEHGKENAAPRENAPVDLRPRFPNARPEVRNEHGEQHEADAVEEEAGNLGAAARRALRAADRPRRVPFRVVQDTSFSYISRRRDDICSASSPNIPVISPVLTSSSARTGNPWWSRNAFTNP